MRHRRSLWVCLAVVVLLASVAVPAQVVKKGQHTLDDLVMASGRLQVPQAVVPGDQLRAESLAAGDKVMEGVFENWDGFLRDNGTTWEMMVDRRGGRVALVSGSGVPWVPGKGNSLRKADIQGDLGGGGKVNNRTLLRLAQRFMERYPDFFGVDPSDLTVMPGGTGEYGGYLWYVQLQRNYAGIPVEDSYIVFRVNNGNLVQFGGENLGRINVDPMPSIDAETARQILQGYVGSLDDSDEWVNPGALSILPMAPAGDAGFFNARPGDGTEFRLVYTVAFRREGVMGTWEAKIDAHTGEILSFLDTNKYGGVTGGIWKVANNESSETIMPMPFAGVSGQYANAAGVYPQTSGSVSASFTGKYVKVTDSCGTSALAGTAPADLAFSKSTGTDCTTPGVGGAGNTHAARSTYYHITNWKVKAMSWLPSNSWLTGQVGDKVNLNQTCNAYWDGSAVNFFKSGGGCSNTGELPTVFLHEIGHGLDSNDGSPASKVGSSESYADINALLMTHASCIGVNFIPGQQCSGYGNACTACTGIRDADYTKHTNSTSPATPAQLANTTGFHCSKSSSYPGPCGYEGHCESYIMSEVGWDLAAKDLPAAGIDANTSWFIADRLFMLTRPTSGDSYTCPAVTTANGCGTSNWFQTYLVADDDNGNLSDGTPHAAAIYAAFNRHLIACTTTVHTNSTTCASIGQPTLTATAGTGTVSLSWTAASGATSYTVLRNEMSATSGMTIIAKGVTGTTYTDNVVAAGITYYYAVVGNTGTITSVGSCFGALSAVKSATPSGGTPPVTYSISGTVSGATASGVTMSLTGAATASTTTDASGNYSFAGLANGSYTVTPSKSGYTFSPVNIAVTISGANQTGKNFTATATGGGDTALTSGVGVSTGSMALQTWKYYTIAVPSGATNLSITLTGLSADLDLYCNNNTTHPTTSAYYGRSYNGGTTNESLSYTNPTVATWSIGVYAYAAGSGTVTATVTTASATYSISGTVSGATASGVTMTLSGAASKTATTDTSGNYTFTGLANGSYTVTPSKSGYTFSPTSLSVTVSGANQTGKNFTATATGGQTTLFTNGFDSTSGWAQVDTSGTAGTWSQVTSGTYPTCSRHGGTYMAKFNSYNASSGSATRYYRTSGFAVSSSFSTVTLTFWMYHDTGYSSSADKVQVQVSTNGTTWTNVGTAVNRYDGSTGWKQHTVDLSAYKGQSALRVAFLGTSAYGNNMYLDDALVVAQ